MTTRRKFIKGAAVVPAAALASPALAQSTIKWRMQTYADPALAEHVVKPANWTASPGRASPRCIRLAGPT